MADLVHYPYCGYAPEEYLEDRLHVVDKHALELFLPLGQLLVFLLLPHLVNEDFADSGAAASNATLILRESLFLLTWVLLDPRGTIFVSHWRERFLDRFIDAL